MQDVTAERLVIPFRQARPEVLPPGFTIAERPPELFGGLLAFKSNFSAQQGPSSGVTEFRTTKTRAVSY